MGAFNFKRNLEVTVEGKTYTIDTSSEAVLKAVVDVTNRSLELHQMPVDNLPLEELQKQIDSTKTMCVDFLNATLGEEKVKEVFKDMTIEYVDLVDLVQYLLYEISVFKNQKINQFVKRS